jgi:hypothetical protein
MALLVERFGASRYALRPHRQGLRFRDCFKLTPIKLRHSLLSRFLFQQKGLDPLFKHHILDFIIIVFKHYGFAFF